MFENIRIDKIEAHPANPRKDLGDLTELADSIRESGIMQNLTVVPTGDCYRAVIGHRRLAAAKLAGLTEVPCMVVEMDQKTQLATMMLENMQRSDLTVYEQAQGFQMMLDLGETMDDIVKKTGFSKSTVKRRVSLLDLDQKKFKDSVKRGATLQDYADLEKIENIELRNSVLDKLGTANYAYALKSAIDKEKADKHKAAMIERLSEFATQVDSEDGYRNVLSFGSYSKIEDINPPEDMDTTTYFFYVTDWGYIRLLVEEVKDETENAEEIEREKKRKELEIRKSQLAEISKRAYELRKEFIKNISGVKTMLPEIVTFAIKSMLYDGWRGLDGDDLLALLSVNDTRSEGKKDDTAGYLNLLSSKISASPEKVLLCAAYCNDMDNESDNYFDYYGRYEKNEELDDLYETLIKLGYQLSDEEKALMNGTHELFSECKS